MPEESGIEVMARSLPAKAVGGDYYDFIPIDQDHLGVLISDVSGHGTPAAVIMAMMRVLLSSFASQTHSPKATLQKLNKILRQNLETGFFITTFYGVIHLPTKKMKYASAGHPPPVFINFDTGSVSELWTDKGVPLMILPNNDMEEGFIHPALAVLGGMMHDHSIEPRLFDTSFLRDINSPLVENVREIRERLGEERKSGLESESVFC